MKDEKIADKDISNTGQVVIPDECGDTMWDAVLAQDFFIPKDAVFNEEKMQQTETQKK
jgi:hypothetical protein